MNNLMSYIEQADESSRCAQRVAEAVSELSTVQKIQVFAELQRLNELKAVGLFTSKSYN